MFKAQESGWRNTKTTDHLHTVKGLVRTLLDVVWYAPFEVGFCTAGQGLTDRSWEGRVRLSEHKISQWKLGWQRYRGLFGSIALFVPDCHVPAYDGVTPLPTISTDPQCLPRATWKEIWTWVDTIVLPWAFNTDSKQYTVNIPWLWITIGWSTHLSVLKVVLVFLTNMSLISILATEPSLSYVLALPGHRIVNKCDRVMPGDHAGTLLNECLGFYHRYSQLEVTFHRGWRSREWWYHHPSTWISLFLLFCLFKWSVATTRRRCFQRH